GGVGGGLGGAVGGGGVGGGLGGAVGAVGGAGGICGDAAGGGADAAGGGVGVGGGGVGGDGGVVGGSPCSLGRRSRTQLTHQAPRVTKPLPVDQWLKDGKNAPHPVQHQLSSLTLVFTAGAGRQRQKTTPLVRVAHLVRHRILHPDDPPADHRRHAVGDIVGQPARQGQVDRSDRARSLSGTEAGNDGLAVQERCDRLLLLWRDGCAHCFTPSWGWGVLSAPVRGGAGPTEPAVCRTG